LLPVAALDLRLLVVRVVVIVAVALADRQRVVVRLAATPSMLTLRSASSAANRPRRFAQTPSNTRRASRSAAGRAAISQPHVNTPERTLSRVNGSTDAHASTCSRSLVRPQRRSISAAQRRRDASTSLARRKRAVGKLGPQLVRLSGHAAPIHTSNAHYTHVQ
jgi:hypothetical protein